MNRWLERVPQLLLLLILLEGPYRALVARRSFDQRRKRTHLDINASTSNFATFPLYLVSLGPFSNPHEKYDPFDFVPFFKPHSNGTAPTFALPDVNTQAPFFPFRIFARDSGFGLQIPRTVRPPEQTLQVESRTTDPLTEEQAEQLARAVKENWVLEVVLAGLPAWGYIGDVESSLGITINNDASKPHIFTEVELMVSRNQDNGEITEVRLTSYIDSLQEINVGQSYTYSMKMSVTETNTSWEDRWLHYYHESYGFVGARPVRWFANLLTVVICFVIFKAQSSSPISRGNLSSEGISLLPASQLEEDGHKDVLREPPKLALLAGLVGAGIQLLLAAWMITWFLSVKQCYPILSEPTGLEFLSLLVSRLAVFSFFGGSRAAKIVLRYASPANVQEHALETFHDELQLMSNMDSDSTEGLEDGSNDEAVYLSVVMREAVVWVFAMGAGFNGLLVAALSLFSKMKGTKMIQAEHGSSLFSMIGLMMLGVASCLLGVVFARRQTLRNPELLSCTEVRSRSSRYQEAWIALLLSGALTYLPIFSEYGFIFESLFSLRFYDSSFQTLVAFQLWIAAITLSTQISLRYLIRSGRRHDWQWIAFGSGAAVSVYVVIHGMYFLSSQTQIYGWYEISLCLSILFLHSVNTGILSGTISYLYGHHFVFSHFRRDAE
jgi:Endomembrane protein 70